jgi:proline dehydrogenase
MLGRLLVSLLPLVPQKIVKAIAMNYVAGIRTEDAVDTCRKINHERMVATLDVLGEEVTGINDAKNVALRYCSLLEVLKSCSLQSNISIKLTHLGVRISKDACIENVTAIIRKAKEYDNFVRIDMEDSSLTETTLKIFRTIRKEYPKVGVAIQAYLRRTEKDTEELMKEGANIRLCKGIYREKSDVAFQGKKAIRENFINIAKRYMKSDGYIAIATHDLFIIDEMVKFIELQNIPKNRFEFQALLGVPVNSTLKRLVNSGYPVRIYIPFGEQWQSYCMRRLKENPNLATYILKNLFSF